MRNLRVAQWEAVHVQTLAAAKERVQDFDLVLLDISLPDSDGFTGLQQLNSLMPEIPILILSGSDDEEIAARALSLGACDYLSKDMITQASLVRSIGLALQRKERTSAYLNIRGSLHHINEKLGGLIKLKQEPDQERILQETILANQDLIRLLDGLI